MNPTNPCRGHAAESERAEGIEAAVRELRLFIMGESLQTRKEASKHLEMLVKQIACGQAPGISGLLAEAHDASLDKDHMGCRAILKQCMRILEDAEVGRLPDGATVIDSGFRFDGQLQQHIPRLVIEFEPVPVGHPSDAKGWKDRDAVASMVAAALSAHADTQPAKVPSNQLAEDFRHFFKRVIAVIPFENYREIGELGGAILEQLKTAPSDDTVRLQPYGIRAKTFDPAFVESLAEPAAPAEVLMPEPSARNRGATASQVKALMDDARRQMYELLTGEARLAPATPAEILDDAQRLIARAQHAGVVLTIETVSVPPLAMGRYVMRAATRPARQPAEKQA